MMMFSGRGRKIEKVKHDRVCDQCGSAFSSIDYQECPHCADLSESELKRLLDKRAEERRKQRNLGYKFAVAAGLLIVILIVAAKIA